MTPERDALIKTVEGSDLPEPVKGRLFRLLDAMALAEHGDYEVRECATSKERERQDQWHAAAWKCAAIRYADLLAAAAETVEVSSHA